MQKPVIHGGGSAEPVLIRQAREWARGRSWWWRLPVLAYLLWAGVRQLTDPEYRSLFAGILFGVHELGHLVFAFLGEFAAVAGGSLAQLLVPVALALLFYRQFDFFGVVVCAAWFSISLAELANYIGDARALELNLVSFGEQAIHDWNYLLGHTGLLGKDLVLARASRFISALVLSGAGMAGAWLLMQMGDRAPSPTDVHRPAV